jgi:disulfide bond formation protein DsbB
MNGLERAGIGAATGSALLLAAALAFQYIGGLAPCEMCIWQRWPHVIAILLGLLMLVAPARWIAALGALVMLAGAAIGFYHAGIELSWWPGPTTCTAPASGDIAPDELLKQILDTPVVLCDEVAWSLLGISMAGWNAIASLVLAGIWMRGYASSSASQ